MTAPNVLMFYGIFLISAGIISVLFIGLKAKTALISGGSTGALSIATSVLFMNGNGIASYFAVIIPLLLLVVFSWRATKTLFSVFSMIQNKDENLHDKGIAFLIISMMAVVSFFIFSFQLLSKF